MYRILPTPSPTRCGAGEIHKWRSHCPNAKLVKRINRVSAVCCSPTAETAGGFYDLISTNGLKTLSKQDARELSLEINVFLTSLYEPRLPLTDRLEVNRNVSTCRRQHHTFGAVFLISCVSAL